jgi:hypothetical protein
MERESSEQSGERIDIDDESYAFQIYNSSRDAYAEVMAEIFGTAGVRDDPSIQNALQAPRNLEVIRLRAQQIRDKRRGFGPREYIVAELMSMRDNLDVILGVLTTITTDQDNSQEI